MAKLTNEDRDRLVACGWVNGKQEGAVGHPRLFYDWPPRDALRLEDERDCLGGTALRLLGDRPVEAAS